MTLEIITQKHQSDSEQGMRMDIQVSEWTESTELKAYVYSQRVFEDCWDHLVGRRIL